MANANLITANYARESLDVYVEAVGRARVYSVPGEKLAVYISPKFERAAAAYNSKRVFRLPETRVSPLPCGALLINHVV